MLAGFTGKPKVKCQIGKEKVEREQIEYLQNKMAAYQLYDTGLTVTKEDELLLSLIHI